MFRIYGMTRWGDLFTARQKLALIDTRQISSARPDRAQIADEFVALR